MSVDENIALVRHYFADCVSPASGPDQANALALVDELMTSDFVMFFNNDNDGQAAHGRNRHKAFLVAHARDYPDDTWTVEAIVADADVVACRWRFEGTHAATGNHVDVRAADFFEVRNGQLAALRRFLDFEGFHDQLRSG